MKLLVLDERQRLHADRGIHGGARLSVFVRSDDDRVRNDLALLDLTPCGRQEIATTCSASAHDRGES